MYIEQMKISDLIKKYRELKAISSRGMRNAVAGWRIAAEIRHSAALSKEITSNHTISGSSSNEGIPLLRSGLLIIERFHMQVTYQIDIGNRFRGLTNL
jgi:hypothetical protein